MLSSACISIIAPNTEAQLPPVTARLTLILWGILQFGCYLLMISTLFLDGMLKYIVLILKGNSKINNSVEEGYIATDWIGMNEMNFNIIELLALCAQ